MTTETAAIDVAAVISRWNDYASKTTRDGRTHETWRAAVTDAIKRDHGADALTIFDLRQYQKEFGAGFTVPDWIVENCQDESWHNDALPVFHYVGHTSAEAPMGFGIWVDSDDPEQSEYCQERKRGERKRFCVTAIQDPTHDNLYGDVLLESDNADDIIAFLTK